MQDIRIDHVHLRSRDAVESGRFFVEALGAREVERIGSPAVTRMVLDLGGLTVFIEQAPAEIGAAAVAPNLGIEHFGLRVDDIEAAMAGLKARGVTVVAEVREMSPQLKIAFIDTPDGIRVELLERK